MIRLFALTIEFCRKVKNRILVHCYRHLFKSCGRNFIFTPGDRFSHPTISVGDGVFIGPGAHFSSITSISIGDNVMFGPNVTIIGGNHNTELTGRPMSLNHTKRPEDDLPIVIENDVWVGAGATILKGVTIRRGAIVGACAVVTKDVGPYAIVTGCPAKEVKKRAGISEIMAHEKECYPEAQRLSESELNGTKLANEG